MTEVQGSSYTNWAQGYPTNNDDHNCVIVDSDDGGITFKWKNVLCSAQYSFYENALCQNPTFDTDRIYHALDNTTTFERMKFSKLHKKH
uniref:C-type lectin domain-containing protein n=1 Tax=Acrobeloides nanus TaxID=290746 RepID=A0A914DEC8_9BILA